MTKFEKVQKALEKAEIPCELVLSGNMVGEDDIDILCGFGLPCELVDKIYDACENVGIEVGDHNHISISADMTGPGRIKSVNIAGGPKEYSLW